MVARTIDIWPEVIYNDCPRLFKELSRRRETGLNSGSSQWTQVSG